MNGVCNVWCVETVYILCFSLILLSVDLCSPHVKNKMGKREFIKNTVRATNGAHAGHGVQGHGHATVTAELAGQLYDNIYLLGHVAPSNTRY